MTKCIAIVDCGMGNLHSVQNAITHLGFNSEIVNDPDKLVKYQKVILPGVGAFGRAMNSLRATGMLDSLVERRDTGAYVLGICLGMQLMCKFSEEDGLFEGIGWFDASVKRFPKESNCPVPHIGWNNVDFKKENQLIRGIKSGGDAYFVHSYHVVCSNHEDVLASTTYGIKFTSMIQKENLMGIQFHPEKSQEFGLKILENYLHI